MHLQFILQIKQVSQPLKYEKEELYESMIEKKIYLQKLDHAF